MRRMLSYVCVLVLLCGWAADRAQPVAAQALPPDVLDISLDYDPNGFVNIRPGETVPFTLTVTLAPGHGYIRYIYDLLPKGNGDGNSTGWVDIAPNATSFTATLSTGANYILVQQGCPVGGLYVVAQLRIVDPYLSYQPTYVVANTLPCSLATSLTPDSSWMSQQAICGDNNDVLYVEQDSVIAFYDPWQNNERVITFTPIDDSVYFPDGATTSFTYTDAGPCVTDPIDFPSVIEEVCGPNNDVLNIPDPPANVLMEDSGWVDNSRVFTYTAAMDYMLPADSWTGWTAIDAAVACDIEVTPTPTSPATAVPTSPATPVPTATPIPTNPATPVPPSSPVPTLTPSPTAGVVALPNTGTGTTPSNSFVVVTFAAGMLLASGAWLGRRTHRA